MMIRNPAYAKRRGASTPMLLMCVMAALLFVVMAVDLAQLSIQRREMQYGGDLIGTSAVDELMDRRWLYGSDADPVFLARLPEMQQNASFDKAHAFAASNTVANSSIELHQEDVTFGYVDYPGAGDDVLQTPSGSKAANTICVDLTRSRLGDNPPILWLSEQTGLGAIDIHTKSQATVATRIHGFQPFRRVNAPIIPLGLFKHPGEGASHSHSGHSHSSHSDDDDRPAQLWWANGPQDQDGDGISEMVFRIRAHHDDDDDDEDDHDHDDGGRHSRPAAMMGFRGGHLNIRAFERMAFMGVDAEDLSSYGGSITTRDQNPALCPAEFVLESHELNDICEILSDPEIKHQPRIWPVVADCSSVMDRPTVGIYGFVAGCVVDCEVDGDSLYVTIEPCLLQTPTALTDGMAQRNPWIGKLLLTR